MLSFHLPQGEMFITLDDILCLLHLPIKEKLLDQDKNIKDKAMEIMVTYLEYDLWDSLKEVEDTQGCHARSGFLKRLYVQQLIAT